MPSTPSGSSALPHLPRPQRFPSRPRGSRSALLAAALLCLCACTGIRGLQDPTVLIETQRGTELGVSTEYGVVFLGRTARAGEIDVTAWFGDGPNVESTVIEPIGNGLYTMEIEIEFPTVPLTFQPPPPGSEVLVVGRNGQELWREPYQLAADPRVEGLLLYPRGALVNRPDMTGAGVFIPRTSGVFLVGDDEVKYSLLGLISGVLTLEGEAGTQQYLTVVGPSDLWRLVSYYRTDVHSRKFTFRPDTM